jgi:hypothetical protein
MEKLMKLRDELPPLKKTGSQEEGNIPLMINQIYCVKRVIPQAE